MTNITRHGGHRIWRVGYFWWVVGLTLAPTSNSLVPYPWGITGHQPAPEVCNVVVGLRSSEEEDFGHFGHCRCGGPCLRGMQYLKLALQSCDQSVH